MKVPESPFGKNRSEEMLVTLLESWLSASAEDQPSTASTMAADIASCYKPFRLDQAAAVLRNLDGPDSAADNEDMSERYDFISIGATDVLEDVLSYSLAGSLDLPVANGAITGLRDLGDPVIQPHSPMGPRGRLIDAIHLAETADPVWAAVSILARIPRVARAVLILDIKTGSYPPALTYHKAFELGKSVLKLAALLSITCRVVLTDTAATDSLAFGRKAQLLSLASSLSGEAEPYLAVSTHMVVEALSVREPRTTRDSAMTAVSRAFSRKEPLRQAHEWRLLQPASWPENQPGSILNSATPVMARSAGYLRHVDKSQIRDALTTTNSRDLNTEEAFVKVQARIGQKLSMGDVLALVGGLSGEQASEHFIEAVCSAFDITNDKLPLYSAIRVTLLPETALVRRQVALALPILKGPYGAKVFLPYAREERSPYIVYFDSSSAFSSTDEIVSMVARKTLPSSIKYTVFRMGAFTSADVAYELATNNVLSLQIMVYAILLESGSKDMARDSDIGRWIEMEQLDALNAQDLPKEISGDWMRLAGLLRTAIN